MQNAAVQVSGLELGGLLGSLSSGAISDYLVRNNDGSRGNVGLRVQARLSPCSTPPHPPFCEAMPAALAAITESLHEHCYDVHDLLCICTCYH